MTTLQNPSPGDILTSFLLRLADVESIVRIVLQQAKIHIMITIRGEKDQTVVMDFTHKPARFIRENPAQVSHVVAAVDETSLHNILMGHQQAGLALGRRRLLLRGSSSHLSKLIPLFDFAPLLYKEHLRMLKINGNISTMTIQEIAMKVKDGSATLEDYEKCTHPLCFLFNWLAYGIGYILGFIRYRLFDKLNIFELLQSMANGIDAATPEKISAPSSPLPAPSGKGQ